MKLSTLNILMTTCYLIGSLVMLSLSICYGGGLTFFLAISWWVVAIVSDSCLADIEKWENIDE